MAKEAKKQAIQDIKEELARNHKSFIMFRSNLNSVMNKLVKEQITEQEKLKVRKV